MPACPSLPSAPSTAAIGRLIAEPKRHKRLRKRLLSSALLSGAKTEATMAPVRFNLAQMKPVIRWISDNSCWEHHTVFLLIKFSLRVVLQRTVFLLRIRVLKFLRK